MTPGDIIDIKDFKCNPSETWQTVIEYSLKKVLNSSIPFWLVLVDVPMINSLPVNMQSPPSIKDSLVAWVGDENLVSQSNACVLNKNTVRMIFITLNFNQFYAAALKMFQKYIKIFILHFHEKSLFAHLVDSFDSMLRTHDLLVFCVYYKNFCDKTSIQILICLWFYMT
ncbi:hypothetical protein BpHYR1_039322 [Brachionus plicatilis]|uniref:Uncharacterized protein n=1 Tax=Brachionus plicatilis TaxID=10195 RepID=A0A3M7R566_BRAPC|nr:hypothetical protein BpHYR1_039322 [Brachionus plicatilis]